MLEVKIEIGDKWCTYQFWSIVEALRCLHNNSEHKCTLTVGWKEVLYSNAGESALHIKRDIMD